MATKKLILNKTVQLSKYVNGSSFGSDDAYLAAGTIRFDADRDRRILMWVGGGIPATWWSGIGVISGLRLWMRGTNTGVERLDRSTATRHKVRRLGAIPSQGLNAVWGDESYDTANEGELITPLLGDVKGKWISFAIEPMALWHAPVALSGKTSQKNQAVFGFVIARDDDNFAANPGLSSSAVGNGEYFSEQQDAAYAPYVELTYDANLPPRAPIVSSPVTLEGDVPQLVARSDGTSVTVVWKQDDPNPGDRTKTRQHNIHRADGTFLKSVVLPGGTNTTGASDVITGLPARSILSVGTKTEDAASAWGPFTVLAEHRFKTAWLPGKPSSVYVQTTPSRPRFYATQVSNDPGDFIRKARIVVDYFPATGLEINVLDAEFDVGGTSNRLDYPSNLELDPAKQYRAQITLYNRDLYPSPASNYYYWTPNQESGPALMIPMDRGVKLLSRTGPLVIGSLLNFDKLRIWLYRDGLLFLDSGVLNVSGTLSGGYYRVTYLIPSDQVAWGEAGLEYEAAIRPVGNADMDPVSPKRPIQINALPDAPFGTVTA